MGKLLNIEFSCLRQIETDNILLKFNMLDFQKGGRAPPTPPSKSATVRLVHLRWCTQMVHKYCYVLAAASSLLFVVYEPKY